MGLFDKLRHKDEKSLTAKAALALAALTIICSDGDADDDEISAITRVIRNDQQALDQAIVVYKDAESLECVKLVAKTLDQKQRVACFAILLDLAMADGHLAKVEEALMQAYLREFQLSEQQAGNLVDVIGLKNDFSVFEPA